MVEGTTFVEHAYLSNFGSLNSGYAMKKATVAVGHCGKSEEVCCRERGENQ